MIFLSTGGFRHQAASVTALNFFSSGINGVELSGGSFSETCQKDILGLSKKMALQLHNYFPPPEVPFVMNVASADDLVTKQSLLHIQNAILMTASLGLGTYSFHAGFRINPNVSELGSNLSRYTLLNRYSALSLFGERVLSLAEFARKHGVNLLIENNVINAKNLTVYGEDPLLFTEPDEINTFMSGMPSNVRLLLDVAHLKVSSFALGFDLLEAHQVLRKWIGGYHLSDNDGMFDSNQCIHDGSWFWEVLNPNLECYTLEVYGEPISVLVEQYKYLTQKILAIKDMRN